MEKKLHLEWQADEAVPGTQQGQLRHHHRHVHCRRCMCHELEGLLCQLAGLCTIGSNFRPAQEACSLVECAVVCLQLAQILWQPSMKIMRETIGAWCAGKGMRGGGQAIM